MYMLRLLYKQKYISNCFTPPNLINVHRFLFICGLLSIFFLFLSLPPSSAPLFFTRFPFCASFRLCSFMFFLPFFWPHMETCFISKWIKLWKLASSSTKFPLAPSNSITSLCNNAGAQVKGITRFIFCHSAQVLQCSDYSLHASETELERLSENMFQILISEHMELQNSLE